MLKGVGGTREKVVPVVWGGERLLFFFFELFATFHSVFFSFFGFCGRVVGSES